MRGELNLFPLVIRNLNLKRKNTIATIALLAIGTFTVFITGSNQRTFYGEEKETASGTGGFLFWTETTLPVLGDLNTRESKIKYGLADEPSLAGVQFIQCLKQEGDDASCLNLNQVARPALLGINTEYFDKKRAFSFVKTDPSVEPQHPWLGLEKEISQGIIPGYADQTVIQWGMRKKIGDTLHYSDEEGRTLKVILMGGLDNSVFQGNVLISVNLFQKYFPSVAGSKVMMVDGELGKRTAIAGRLNYLFQDYGISLVPASERLAQFNSVENTYLTVFMMLGGLAMLIGTIGLGIVLMHNLEERNSEIALYRALGLPGSMVWRLLFTEYLLILLSGMGIGLLAALAGILPSFVSPAFELPAGFLLGLFVLILASGLLWIYFPLKAATRRNLLSALWRE